jgi:WD40 repeat protein
LITQPVVFSPDGTRFILIFGGKEGVVPVWDTASGRELMVLKGIHPSRTAAFSPDGKRILTGGITGKSAWIWDARTGRELLNFPRPAEVTAVAFSPDGRRVLIGAEDGFIEVIPAADYP